MNSRPTPPAKLRAIIKLAESGSPLAQFRLGEIYADCWDIHEDLDQSIYWYRKAAQQGYKQAFPRLAVQLRHLAYIRLDVASEALKWLQEAAIEDCHLAAYWLSEMYCLELPCRAKFREEAGIKIPEHWLEEITQSEKESFVWLEVSEELQQPDDRDDQYVRLIREELVSKLTPEALIKAHESITAALEEVDRRRNETPFKDDL